MVGSVLMQRMREENDFAGIDPVFFTTSNVGGKGPDIGKDIPALQDAFDIDSLKPMDVIITCQGGDYTKAVFPELRNAGWKGYWIDAASALRMDNDAVIILDPVNQKVIDQALADDILTAEEAERLREADARIMKVIAVDDFSSEELARVVAPAKSEPRVAVTKKQARKKPSKDRPEEKDLAVSG